MSHYDVLGVRPSVGQAELRQAYLRLAREHHPDRHAGSSPQVRAAAEQQMRLVNEAWETLRDPERRHRYDATIDRSSGATIADPEDGPAWTPYDLGPDEVDDRLDDSHRPAPRGGRLLAMAPPAVLTAGALALVVGTAFGWRLLVALGAMGLILGGALFVVASLSVVLESRQNDLR